MTLAPTYTYSNAFSKPYNGNNVPSVLPNMHTNPSAVTGVDTFSTDNKGKRFFKSDIPYWVGGTFAASGSLFPGKPRYGRTLAFGGILMTLAKGAYDYRNI